MTEALHSDGRQKFQKEIKGKVRRRDSKKILSSSSNALFLLFPFTFLTMADDPSSLTKVLQQNIRFFVCVCVFFSGFLMISVISVVFDLRPGFSGLILSFTFELILNPTGISCSGFV